LDHSPTVDHIGKQDCIMNFRTTYILFAAVAVLLVVFILVMTFGSRGDADEFVLRPFHEEARKEDEVAKLQKEFDHVEIERLQPAEPPLVFKREGAGAWKLTAPYPARIDANIVNDIIRDLTTARLDRTADMGKLDQLGLANPSAAVTLKRGSKSYRIVLGKMTIGGDDATIYVLADDRGKEPIAIRRSSLRNLFRSDDQGKTAAGDALKSVADFRPRSMLADGSFTPWDIVNLVRLKDGAKELVLQKNPQGAWMFIKPEGYGAVDPEGEPVGPATENLAGLKPLLTALANWRLPGRGDMIEGVTDLSPYGLEPGKELMHVELHRAGGIVEVVRIGKKTEEKGEKVFAAIEGERFVVKLESKAVEPVRRLLADPVVMRDRNLVQFSAPSVDAVNIRVRNQPFLELRLIGDPPQWRVYEEGSDEAELANNATVTQLLEAITKRRQVKDFPDSAATLDAKYGLNDPDVQISIWQSGIDIEKKDDKTLDKNDAPLKKPRLKGDPTIRLNFGRKEKDYVFARRFTGAASTVVTLPESLLAAISRPSNDYVELQMPSFDSLKTTKLIFPRGAVRYEIEKTPGETSNTWKFAAPPELKGRLADAVRMGQIILNLSNMQAASLVTKKPTDADLQKFGLKPAKAEVTVHVASETPPRVFSLGIEKEGALYMRVSPKERVYLVSKHTVEALLSGELEDPTLVRFDIAKLRSLKLNGWKNIVGSPTTLTLDRASPGSWSVRDKPEYKVDPLLAEQFAVTLSQLRCDRFVKRAGGPDAEHQLDVNQNALTVEITLEGQKDSITAAFGGFDKDGKMQYATSSQLTGTVMALPKERLAKIMEKPAVFQKN
jgi:hypothetical protein